MNDTDKRPAGEIRIGPPYVNLGTVVRNVYAPGWTSVTPAGLIRVVALAPGDEDWPPGTRGLRDRAIAGDAKGVSAMSAGRLVRVRGGRWSAREHWLPDAELSMHIERTTIHPRTTGEPLDWWRRELATRIITHGAAATLEAEHRGADREPEPQRPEWVDETLRAMQGPQTESGADTGAQRADAR